jgi:hypothetical protein
MTERGLQRRIRETLPAQPPAVLGRPVLAGPPDPAVPQQHRQQSLLRPFQIGHQITANPHQVSHRLLRRRGHPDRGQLPGPIQPGQAGGVPPVGLDPIPTALGNQRRSDHLTGHPQARQQPVQLITTRTRLITGPQRTGIIKPTDQPPHRRLVVEDPVDVGNLLTRSQDPHHNRILRRIHPQMD